MRKLTEEEKKLQDRRQHMLQNLTAFTQSIEKDKPPISGLSDEDMEFLSYPVPVRRSDLSAPQNPPVTKENPDGIMDVITFCEHPFFLNLKLTPWQKVMVKLFYAGEAGNTHLIHKDEHGRWSLDDTRSETGCGGCVWQYNREIEEIYCKSNKRLEGDKIMLPDNSPCLRCSRFPVPLREKRYKYLFEEAITEVDTEDLQVLKDREILDLFMNEMEMFERDLEKKTDVKEQIREKMGRRYNELILVLGRRSGKSFLVSIIALYEVYKFLMMGHPQAKFPIMEFDTITICNVAVSEGQAKSAIFDKIRQLVLGSPFFKPFMGKTPTQLEMHFLTPHDLAENERRKRNGQQGLDGTIQLMSGHSNSAALVGRTMAVIVIDEMAEMAKSGGDGGTDSDLYTKLKPSIATFGRFGKIICISNPLQPVGKFHELYQASFKDKTTLMFQLPTWYSNPNIDRSYLESEKLKDPVNFGMHYGAEFGSTGSSPFLPKVYIELAFERGKFRKRAEYGVPLMRYFAHLDPARSSNNYTLAVTHTEPIPHMVGPDNKPLMRVVVDHIHMWMPSGNFPVNVTEVDDYILKIANKFKLSQISYDQWNSEASITKLRNHGLNAVCTPFVTNYINTIYDELYQLFTSERIDFYNENSQVINPRTEMTESLGEVKEAKLEFEMLQKKWVGSTWKVEAPTGFFDDICDAVAGSAFQALKAKVYIPMVRPSSFMLGGRFR